MAIVKKATINGRTVKRDCASLYPNRLRGYWADVDGNKIDKITFGSTVRFYIETYWAYNARIKIYIKSNVSIILNKPEEKIVEDTIDKLIPGYFAMERNFFEIKLKKFGDYKELQGMKDLELFCDITEGFDRFYGYENVAKISISSNPNFIDFHVYSEDKRIEKHIPVDYIEGESVLLKYRYFYHINGQEYFITTLNAIQGQKYVTGTKKRPSSDNYTVRTGLKGAIYYIKGDGNVILVELPSNGINVTVGNRLIKYSNNTTRKNCLPEVAASLFGALAECSYNFIVFNGCTNTTNNGYPSISHAGGYNIDFRYIRRDRRLDIGLNIALDYNSMDLKSQNSFIDALKVFGWSDPRGHNPTQSSLKVKHLPGHGDHLHCQGYNKLLIIKKI